MRLVLEYILEWVIFLRMELINKAIRKYYETIRERKKNNILLKISNGEFVKGINNTEIREQKIILSMKTYLPRYNSVVMCIKSLLNQTVKPDRFIVWLDDNVPKNQPTKDMLELCQYGVEYRFTKDDLKPHGKYYYAMQEYPNDIVITVDDDLLYSDDLIESLMNSHKRYPECVCARRTHRMKYHFDSSVKPYTQWRFEDNISSKPSFRLFATGGSGALYPPHLLPLETFDAKLIKKLSLNADDIWLKCMEMKNNIKVCRVNSLYPMPAEVSDSQNVALNATNVHENKNDFYLNLIINYFPELKVKFTKKYI